MLPVSTQFYLQNARSRDVESFCDFFLGKASQEEFLNFAHVVFGKLRKVMGFAFYKFRPVQACIECMFSIFGTRAPFEVFDRIILFISVYVVDEGLVFWIGNEGLSDDSVKISLIALIFKRKEGDKVFTSGFRNSRFVNLVGRIAVAASNSLNSSKIGNLIVGKLFYCFPNFGRMSLHAFSPLQKVFAKARSRFTALTSFFILPRLQLRSE